MGESRSLNVSSTIRALVSSVTTMIYGDFRCCASRNQPDWGYRSILLVVALSYLQSLVNDIKNELLQAASVPVHLRSQVLHVDKYSSNSVS
jgi:hypothetical protein